MSVRPVAAMGALVVALVVASCSSGGGDGGAATTSTSSATSSSAVSSVVTSVVTTEVAPTTSNVGGSPTTETDETTTSTAVASSEEELVVAAYQAAYDAYWAAAQAPTDPALRREVQRTHRGRSLEFLTEQLDKLAIAGERVVANPTVPDGFVVEHVVIAADAATVIACTVNSWIWVRQTGDAPEPTVVVDDEIVVTRAEIVLGRIDQEWFRVDGSTIETLDGATSCA